MLARIVFVSEWLQSPALLRCTEPRRMTRCWCLHRIAKAIKSAWRTPSRSSPLFYSQSPDGRLRTLCSHMPVAREPTLLLTLCHNGVHREQLLRQHRSRLQVAGMTGKPSVNPCLLCTLPRTKLPFEATPTLCSVFQGRAGTRARSCEQELWGAFICRG